MAYIYKITNLVNGKIYVGATKRTIKKRWGEHIRDSRKEFTHKRPLHIAIREYGKENFEKELLEEVEDSIMNEREQFWIETLGSFNYGYNATFGGEGTPSVDYNLVVNTYRSVLSKSKTSEILGVDASYIADILKIMEEPSFNSSEMNSRKSRPIAMMDNEDNIIRVFKSAISASQYVSETKTGKINLDSMRNCIICTAKGQRKKKKAYGYGWCFF